MQFDGSVTINAPLEHVWNFLVEPASISQCVPGLDTLEIVVPGKQFKAVASLGLGNMRVVFNANIDFVELQPPHYAKMKAHGDAPGSAADVVSEMRLTNGAENGTTELQWSAEIAIVGKIAATAARLMPSVTRKMTATFFDCVKSKIETTE